MFEWLPVGLMRDQIRWTAQSWYRPVYWLCFDSESIQEVNRNYNILGCEQKEARSTCLLSQASLSQIRLLNVFFYEFPVNTRTSGVQRVLQWWPDARRSWHASVCYQMLKGIWTPCQIIRIPVKQEVMQDCVRHSKHTVWQSKMKQKHLVCWAFPWTLMIMTFWLCWPSPCFIEGANISGAEYILKSA